MRVLLVDDEVNYRNSLSASLQRHGHQVSIAGTGRQAIDLGLRTRPEILVSDWMLRNHLHGLHVSAALSTVYPELQTIIMTGYPSEDLRADARKAGVFQLLEKPFDLDSLVVAIDDAAVAERPEREPVSYGLLAVDPLGAILCASETAREMLSRTFAGANAAHLSEVFGRAAIAHLELSNEAWVPVACEAPEPLRWWARSGESLDGRLIILHEGERAPARGEVPLQLLLAIDEPQQVQWNSNDRVLVIEGEAAIRDLCVRQLDRIGCRCYKAESLELGFELFRADPEINVVVLDRVIAGTRLREVVKQLRGTRLHVKIVGTSANPRSERDFAAIGVKRFLDKPWRSGDLVDALRN